MSNDANATASERGREAIVRRYYELVDEGAHEQLVDLFAEDVVYERPGQGAIEGRDALLEFYEAGRPLSGGSHEVIAVVVDEASDAVAVRGSFSGNQGGEAVSFGFADFHEFDGEKIRRRYTYTDRDTV